MIYADTSFLSALYRQNDAFHAAAMKLMLRTRKTIALTLLGEFEFLNNVHRGLGLKILTQAEHDAILRQFAADQNEGILVRQQLPDADIYARARILSKKFAAQTNARSLDILHVSAAGLLRTSSFATYDIKQRALVQKVGLPLLPGLLSSK